MVEFLLPMAFVHKDVLDHAIWTVAVASLLMVADHRHHHSLELEQAEAPVVETADVIAHAMHFRLSLSLTRRWELEAILAKVQADQADHVVQEVPEVHKVGTSGSSKKVKFGGDG